MAKAKRKSKTVPLALHKRLVIFELQVPDEKRARETLLMFWPDGGGFASPKDAAQALIEFPGQWIVDGELREDADTVKYYRDTYGLEFHP